MLRLMMVICDVLRVIHACEGDDTATGGSNSDVSPRACVRRERRRGRANGDIVIVVIVVVIGGIAIGVADGTSTAWFAHHWHPYHASTFRMSEKTTIHTFSAHHPNARDMADTPRILRARRNRSRRVDRVDRDVCSILAPLGVMIGQRSPPSPPLHEVAKGRAVIRRSHASADRAHDAYRSMHDVDHARARSMDDIDRCRRRWVEWQSWHHSAPAGMDWDDDDDDDDGGEAWARAACDAVRAVEAARAAVEASGRANVRGAPVSHPRAQQQQQQQQQRQGQRQRQVTVEFVPHGVDRFAIVVVGGGGGGGGDDDVVCERARGVPGAAVDAATRRWTVPREALERAREAFAGAAFVVKPVPGIVLRAMDVKFDAFERACEATYAAKVSKALDAKMFDFQREGVRYALRRGGRVLIGDEMGLGKTVQACALLSCYRDECPALILVPTSLRECWRNALQTWLNVDDGDIACVASGNDGDKLIGSTFDIVPYSLVVKLLDRLQRKRYQVIVADESHFLKDRKTKRTAAVTPLLRDARRAICLTGTPALNRPIELFTQLAAIVPRVFTTVSEFGNRYCQGGGPFAMWSGKSNGEELHAIISRLCMVRRLKKDVLTSLPAKQRTQVWLTPEAKDMTQVKAIKAQLEKLRAAGNASEFEEKRLVNALYAASANAKQEVVNEYLETVIEGSEAKFLFFAHHTAMLDGVSQFLAKKKIKFIRIDGSTASTARGALVDTFQKDDTYRVAVLSIIAAGSGLTLTAASTVIFGEMSWTPGHLIQAEDRAHRIGQVSNVLVQYLHAKGTIDDIIWGSINNKLEGLGQVLDGHRGKHLETEESLQRKEQRKLSDASPPNRSPKKSKLSNEIDPTQRTITELFSSQATQKTKRDSTNDIEWPSLDENNLAF